MVRERNVVWTVEKIKRLRALCELTGEAYLPTSIIAERMGISIGACGHKINQLSLPRRKSIHRSGG